MRGLLGNRHGPLSGGEIYVIGCSIPGYIMVCLRTQNNWTATCMKTAFASPFFTTLSPTGYIRLRYGYVIH